MKVIVDEKKNKELMEKQEIEIDIFAENENGDILFKLLSPTFQIVKEKQRAEIESAKRREKVSKRS